MLFIKFPKASPLDSRVEQRFQQPDIQDTGVTSAMSDPTFKTRIFTLDDALFVGW